METNSLRNCPLHDYVLVRRQVNLQKTASGIEIPEAASKMSDQGEVITVGAGALLKHGKVRPPEVRAGDRVLFGKHAGQAVKVGGEELLVMREADIIAVL